MEAKSSRTRARVDTWLPLAVPVMIVLLLWLIRAPLLWAGGRGADVAGACAHDLVAIPALQGFQGFAYLNLYWSGDAGAATYFGDHFRYVIYGIVFASAIGLPLGLVITEIRILRLPFFVLIDAIYTVPSLILYVILLEKTGLSDTTVLIVIVAYAQFILVRNVVVGLDGVPPDAIEAARGMGMSWVQILFRVRLPLAMPVIVTGLRIATVVIIAVVALSAAIAMPSLGSLFFIAVQNGGVSAYGQIEAGAILVTALALGADLVLRIVEYAMPASRVRRAQSRSRVKNLLRLRRSSVQTRDALEAE